jgi:hypothetical protein
MVDDQGQVQFDYPSSFQVEIRELLPISFDYIIQPLSRVFAASVETGNPVRWC